MKGIWIAGAAVFALVMAPMAQADEATAAAPATTEATAQQPADASAPAVSVTAAGDHAVVVSTGNATVDEAANYASKCTERAAALKSCDTMGGFKAMGCRKMAEMRYKSVNNCPNL